MLKHTHSGRVHARTGSHVCSSRTLCTAREGSRRSLITITTSVERVGPLKERLIHHQLIRGHQLSAQKHAFRPGTPFFEAPMCARLGLTHVAHCDTPYHNVIRFSAMCAEAQRRAAGGRTTGPGPSPGPQRTPITYFRRPVDKSTDFLSKSVVD